MHLCGSLPGNNWHVVHFHLLIRHWHWTSIYLFICIEISKFIENHSIYSVSSAKTSKKEIVFLLIRSARVQFGRTKVGQLFVLLIVYKETDLCGLWLNFRFLMYLDFILGKILAKIFLIKRFRRFTSTKRL